MNAHIFDENISKTDYGVGVVEKSPTRVATSAAFVEPISSPTIDASAQATTPSEKEIEENSRARSAKLRVAEKL